MYFFINLKNKIVWIVALSFFISLTYSFYFQIRPVIDAQAYDRIALNLLSGQGFKEDSSLSFDYDIAMLRAGPGYEFFLAAIYFIFGHHYQAVWIWQALLHAATAWLVYKCTMVFWSGEKGEVIGLIGAALIGFHPDLIEISAMLMTETLYLFLIVLIVYLFVQVMIKESRILVLSLGAFTSLGILVRPTLVLFFPIFAVYFISKKQWRKLILLVAAGFIVLLPWTMRNYLRYEQIIPTTMIGQVNLWVGNLPGTTGGQYYLDNNPVTALVAEKGIQAVPAAATQAFTTFIATHPVEFARVSAFRLVRYLSLIRPMGFWFYDQGVSQLMFVILSGLSIAGLFSAGLAGMIIFLQDRHNKILGYLCALTLVAPLPLLVTVVQSRYRFQIYPFLAWFGAYAIYEFFNKNKSAQNAALISGLILGSVSLLDLVISWQEIIDHLNKF